MIGENETVKFAFPLNMILLLGHKIKDDLHPKKVY